MYYVQLILLLCSILKFSECGPIVGEEEGMKYLEKFGYTNSEPMESMTFKEKENAIKYFQKMNDLPVTGNFDEKTMEQMDKPRCGRPDRYRQNALAFRYNGARVWRKRYLTFKLNNFPRNGLSRAATTSEIRRAFATWSQYIPLRFIQIGQGRADIEITFNPSNVGDGPGRTLAYAYYPENGNAYFDTENWTVRSRYGINLFNTAAHEFGHSLGLDHSEVRGALMYPYIGPYNPYFRLHQNDISRIQRLYGSGAVADSCNLANIDATFSPTQDIVYALSGEQVWKFQNKTVVSGYPKLISEEWSELPSAIDAAYFYKNNIYFIKDSSVWIYSGTTNKTVLKNTRAEKVDAMFIIRDKAYLFAGSNYSKYTVTSSGIKLNGGFPKTIDSFWKGVPSSVDAVYFDHERHINFIKNNTVYSFDTNNPTEAATSKDLCEFFNFLA